MNSDQYTFEELAKLIEGLPSRHKQKIVAIDGLSGSGKIVFTDYLRRALPHSAVIHIDDFTKVRSERVEGTDFTVSPNIDWDRFDHEVMTPLGFGQPVIYHKYEAGPDELGEKATVSQDAVIFVEGEYVTQNRFAESYDFKIWIDTNDAARGTRILEGEGEKKWKAWQDEGKPIEQNYLEREKQNIRADLVVNGGASDFKTGCYKIFKN